MSGVGRTSCDVCRQAYDGSGMETPCDTCRPALKKENVPYFILHGYCQDQYIMGYGGPVGLSMLAINQAMIDYEIDMEERIDFSSKVRLIANIIISSRADEAAEERKRNKK